MKLNRKWINEEFVDLHEVSDKEFVEMLTVFGQKVETWERMDAEIKNVVVGKVVSIVRHPNSDHMFICQVDVGQAEPVQIVTGAQNVHEGDLVPAALHNSYLPGGVHITKGKLRGEVSNGMLCSFAELGLTQNDLPGVFADGIWILEPDAGKPGDDINKIIGNDDTVVDFEITNNRPDCYSIIGLARETAAAFGKHMRHHEPVVHGSEAGSIFDHLDVEVEGMGIVASCTVAPKDGMKVLVNSDEIRKLRRINLELLLSSGNHDCTLCSKSNNCKLQKLAKDLDVTEIRFKSKKLDSHKDATSPALVRDHSKCILCGNCVRICNEVQGIGAIDFAFRGFRSKIATAFNKELGQSHECVSCGQCARVCPTGALMPNSSEIEDVFKAINNPAKKVAVHIAPAVRVGLGEIFGLPQGQNVDGKIAAALRMLGFDYVYDTAFAADLTIVEEAGEFLERFRKGTNLPQFTSCCPAWVNYVEKFAPEFIPNLSTARSPMQMMGPILKADYEERGGKREDLVVVAIMPCSAKKSEAKRGEFYVNGNPDTDYVVTTVGLARMIKSSHMERFATVLKAAEKAKRNVIIQGASSSRELSRDSSSSWLICSAT